MARAACRLPRALPPCNRTTSCCTPSAAATSLRLPASARHASVPAARSWAAASPWLRSTSMLPSTASDSAASASLVSAHRARLCTARMACPCAAPLPLTSSRTRGPMPPAAATATWPPAHTTELPARLACSCCDAPRSVSPMRAPQSRARAAAAASCSSARSLPSQPTRAAAAPAPINDGSSSVSPERWHKMPVAAEVAAGVRKSAVPVARSTSGSTASASLTARQPSRPVQSRSSTRSAWRCTASWLHCSNCTQVSTPPCRIASRPDALSTSSSSAAAAACATSPPPSRRTASISTSAPPAAATASLCSAHESAASTRHASRLPLTFPPSRPLTWAIATRAATPPHPTIASRASANLATCRRLPAAACCSARPPPSCDTNRPTAASELATAACAPSSPPVASLCNSRIAYPRASSSGPLAKATNCARPVVARTVWLPPLSARLHIAFAACVRPGSCPFTTRATNSSTAPAATISTDFPVSDKHVKAAAACSLVASSVAL
eukprot:scaffold7207_cov62-Phaeocystis_antarctica.AAC.14